MSDHPTPAQSAPEAERPTGDEANDGWGSLWAERFRAERDRQTDRAEAAESRARAAEEELERVRRAMVKEIENWIVDHDLEYQRPKLAKEMRAWAGAAHPTQGEERG